MFQKINIYLLVLTLLSFCSCAEEGPYTLGKLECYVEVSSITPSTATVTVSIPDSDDNLFNGSYATILLSDHYPSPNYDYMSNNLITADPVSNRSTFYFSNLTPSTTYYVISDNHILFNGKSDNFEWYYYYTGYSFTTSAEGDSEGDYSTIGDVTAEVVNAESGFAAIRITLPEGLQFYSGRSIYLEASMSPDFSDTIETKEDIFWHYDGRQVTFQLADLKPNKYYLRLRGDFSLEGHLIDQTLTVNVKYPIDLSGMDMTKSLCPIRLAGADFTLFQVSLPDFLSLFVINNVSISSGEITYENFNTELYSQCLYCPSAFVDGEELSINLTATYSYGQYNGGDYYTKELKIKSIYNSDNTILQNPKCNTIFAGYDYSLVKIEYPTWFSSITNDVSFYLGEGKLYPESYVSIPWIHEVRNYVLVNNNTMNSSNAQYLMEKGDFKVSGYNESIYGKINIDGKVIRGEETQNLFQVSTEKNNDGLCLVINLANGFEGNWGYYEYPRLSIRDGQNTIISVDFDSNLSTNKRIVFPLKTYHTEVLETGKNYILDFTHFDDLYYTPEKLNISRFATYTINWTY